MRLSSELKIIGRLSVLIFLTALATGCGDDDSTGPGPTTGTIGVSVSSTGDDIDADGYAVLLDGNSPQSVGVDGSVTLSSVEPGDRQVELSGVADNCSVAGSNPQIVNVIAGQQIDVSFQVACTALTGTIEVTTVSSGVDIDPDGYAVSVDGAAAQPVGANATLALTGQTEADHEVLLSGVAPNCSVTGSNPRTVTVTSASTTTTTFEVECGQAVGQVEITTSTSGFDPDPDGYEISIDNGTPQGIGLNETIQFMGVPAGEHTFALSGIAANCGVTGDPNPRTASVANGGTVQIAFEVSCDPLPEGRIVFHSDRDGDFDIYVANSDGTGVTPLTSNTVLDQGPSVSPDGTKIAFWSDRDGSTDLYIMDVDGSNVSQVTSGGAAERQPAWSPDATKLVYARVVNNGATCNAPDGACNDIFVINLDGTNAVNLTQNPDYDDIYPAWSPDGTKIAFTSYRSGSDYEVYVMDADGTNTVNISNRPAARDGRADWSPDGSRIAFDAKIYDGGSAEIWLMDPDGTDKVRLTFDSSEFVDFQPRWSPDGTQLAFSSDRDGNPEIYVMLADGSGQTRLTNSNGVDGWVDWIP